MDNHGPFAPSCTHAAAGLPFPLATRNRLPNRHTMYEDNLTTRPVPSGWLDVISEGQADLAARRIVSGEDVINDLRQGLERLESNRR